MTNYITHWIENCNLNIQCLNELLEEKSQIQQDGKKIRKCNASFFQRVTKTGESIKRSWLCFSPTTGRLYWFFCKLFDELKKSPFADDGYFDWKHAHDRLAHHETSATHLRSLINFNNLKNKSGRIDIEIEKQIENSALYWRKVLKRVIDVIIFLSERGLAFRGSNESLGNPNNGNFLGIIELLAKYDPFLKEHIENYGNCGSGRVNYLSSTIYEELIEEIGKAVHQEIIRRLKVAKIYSVSVDGTKDIGVTKIK